jgi:hypothetical protein
MGRSAAQTERRQYECKTQSACENGHPRSRQVLKISSALKIYRPEIKDASVALLAVASPAFAAKAKATSIGRY